MPNAVRWVLAVLVVTVALGPPVAFFRYTYIHAKRFREVVPGRFYRTGQFTASGLRQIVAEKQIKMVINLQHEEPDPLLPDRWMGTGKIRESELCRQLGVKYVLLKPDIVPDGYPLDRNLPVINEFLALLDDEANYPILLHCKAGLHRTGRLTAIYRMEYLGWSQGEALRELRANGYGYSVASEGDEFVVRFLQNYRPRPKGLPAAPPPRPVKDRGPAAGPEGGGS